MTEERKGYASSIAQYCRLSLRCAVPGNALLLLSKLQTVMCYRTAGQGGGAGRGGG